MRFETVADELYALPRDEFTAVRTERAKEAKPRQPDLAKRITELRKPTVAAWLVNQVARRHPDEVAQLADLGERLRAAHQKLAGDELRTLSRQRNELIRRLGGRAGGVAGEAGVAYSDVTMRQVEDTFEAAVSNPDCAAEVRAGQLSAALTPSSSEDWLAAALAASPKRTAPPKPPPEKPPAKKKPQRDPEAERRQAALADARAQADTAASARDEARRKLDEVTARADKAAETVAELRERLENATREERAIRKELTAARKASTAADKAADEARQRVGEMQSFGRRSRR